MAIYRGPGGSGDAVNDSSSETRLAVEARDAAIAAKNAAEAAQAAAETAETNAETAETNAETAETNAETAATNAASSASSASSSASSASSSASAASTSASNASTSASSAATSATNASNSASAASTSATNAANSATAAATSATNASNSATSASTSASTATTKASEASTSATNAASSASSASGSASTATTQAGIATTKASEASTSATNAASSASAASTSATNASNSASSASTSATNASNSASAANTSAINAASSASSSQAAADAALAALDSFDDRYLGQKSTAPTVDNDGNALVTGALYFDTTDDAMKVWDGSSWLSAYASLSGALIATNNLSDLSSASTARTNLGLGTAATTAATDYATAAQGAKADTALQSAAIGVTVQGYDADLAAFALKTAPTGDVVGTSDTQTLTNKTLTSPSINGSVATTGLNFDSNTFVIDATNNRVGVGTASPSYRLDIPVTGTVAANLGGVLIGANGTDVVSNTGLLSLQTTGATNMTFFTNSSERMRITSAGNVGIGTSSPAARLHATQATAGATAARINGVAGTYNFDFNGSGDSYFDQRSIVFRKFDATACGSLETGTNTAFKLTSTSGIAVATLNTQSGNTAFLTYEAGGTETAAITANTSALMFSNGSGRTERMRIDSSGNVGIGTSSPSSYGKLGVVSGVSYFGVASDTYTSAKFGPRPVNDGAVSVLYEYGGNGSGGYWKTDTTSGSHQLYRIGTIVAEWDSSSNFKFNSGYGSAATAYGCRAWVNFNGTGTVAIRASGNVSSITDNGTGDYTLNFTTAMPDANYSISGYCLAASGGGSAYIVLGNDFPPAAGSCRVGVGDIGNGARDVAFVMFQIFR